MKNAASVRLLLVVCWMMLGIPAAEAQMYRQTPNNRMPAMQKAVLTGKYEGVVRGGIAVQAENGRVWQVAVPATAQVRVTGTASRDCLQSNLVVEFRADIDSHGKAQSPIEELTLVSLSKDRQFGLYPAAAEKHDGDKPEGGERGEDRRGPDDAKKEVGKDATRDVGKDAAKSDGRAARGRGRNSGGLAEGYYRVIGRLMVGRDGQLTAQTGQSVVSFELAEDATIKIDCSDLSIVSKGNDITVGGMVANARAGVMQANQIRVKLAEELAGPKKKAPQKTEAKRPARSEKKDQDSDAGLPQPPGGW